MEVLYYGGVVLQRCCTMEVLNNGGAVIGRFNYLWACVFIDYTVYTITEGHLGLSPLFGCLLHHLVRDLYETSST